MTIKPGKSGTLEEREVRGGFRMDKTSKEDR